MVPDRGGNGGMTLPYRQRGPLKVFVQWNGSIQDGFGKSILGAAWRIGWRKQDSMQDIHAIVKSQGRRA